MKKYHLLAGALAALAIAPAAQAQQYTTLETWSTSQSITGPSGSSTVNANWSIHTASGLACNQNVSLPILTEYTGVGTPTLAGKGSPAHPDVLINTSNNASIPGTILLVPPGTIVMHPGNGTQECVILRFTVPKPLDEPGKTSQRVYKLTAQFMGAYAVPNVNPPVPGRMGCFDTPVPAKCGVTGMIRITRNWVYNGQNLGNQPIGSTRDTKIIGGGPLIQGPYAAMRPGDTVDFAIYNNGGYNYDSTLLAGKIERQN